MSVNKVEPYCKTPLKQALFTLTGPAILFALNFLSFQKKNFLCKLLLSINSSWIKLTGVEQYRRAFCLEFIPRFANYLNRKLALLNERILKHTSSHNFTSRKLLDYLTQAELRA